jgi:glutaredoxin-related protein
MSALLVYSNKCQHSRNVIQYINSNQQLKQIVRFHDVNTQGVPQQYAQYIKSVPTMLTKNGKVLVGNEIKNWLESLLPVEFSSCSLLDCGLGASLDDPDDKDGYYSLDDYGKSLQPAMTPDLEAKVSQSVNEAFNNNKR